MNFSNITDWTITEGTVKQVTDSLGRVIWERDHHNYSQDYFFIEDASGSNNTITFKKVNHTSEGDAPTFFLYKSTDQTNWSSLGYITTAGFTVTIPANSKVYFRANTTGWSDPDYPDTFLNYMRSTSDYKVGGNIMSLLKGAGFYGSDFTGCNAYCLHNIFSGNLIDASNLVLPSTTLIKGCYANMFYMTKISRVPELPATTLADSCYNSMFFGCKSLTTPPTLPATILSDYCYQGMFRGCTSLTTAPALPATTLADICYSYMFYGCTSLNSVTTYANDISASNCLYNWLSGVAATGTFHNLGTATYPSGDSGIPSGWTEVNS